MAVASIGSQGGTGWHSQGGFNSDVFIMTVEIAGTGAEVRVLGSELNKASGGWMRWSKTESVSYVAQVGAVRHANEFYILGRAQDGSTVIERWDWPRIAGAYCSERTAALQPIGQGFRSPDTDIFIEGGPFVSPADRTPSPAAVRAVVYVGPTLGTPRDLIADPDGRFLLVVAATPGTGATRLLQVPLNSGGAVVEIVASGEAPELLRDTHMISAQHARMGRVHLAFAGDVTFWLEDRNNDGVIDSWNHLDFSSFGQAFPDHEWSRWFR